MTNNSIDGDIKLSEEEEKALKEQRLKEYVNGSTGGSTSHKKTSPNETGLTSIAISPTGRQKDNLVDTYTARAQLYVEGIISYDGI